MDNLKPAANMIKLYMKISEGTNLVMIRMLKCY